MRYGSICSGIEAATVAWEPFGWTPAWFAEIEPFPCSVLAHHYPEVPNYGDMTKLAGRIRAGEAEAPDLLVGGTPCQAFSVAGLRKGLNDERGQLTPAFALLADAIDEVRAAEGKPPVIIVWENVPGVLSDKDNAYGCFLGLLAGEDIELRPPGGRWTNAGLVLGPTRQVAWRILDAQYFGVAQRRRRVFVVASAGGRGVHPAQVLFIEPGMRRDSPPSREARQGAPAPAAVSAASGGEGRGDGTGSDGGRGGGVAIPLLDAAKGRTDVRGSRDGSAMGEDGDPMFTLRAGSSHGVAHGVAQRAIAFDTTQLTNHNNNRSNPQPGDPCHPLAAGAHPPSVAQTIAHVDVVGTLSDGAHNGGGLNGQAAYTGRVLPVAPSLTASNDPSRSPQSSEVTQQVAAVHAASMAVRRLTPVECERLQGFPDDYTRIPWRGKPAEECPDGGRYKALGNSMAVPVMRWIGNRINNRSQP